MRAKSIVIFLLIALTHIQLFSQNSNLELQTYCLNVTDYGVEKLGSLETMAVNDTFSFVVNCNSNILTGNVLKNDHLSADNLYRVCFVYAPKEGILTFGSNGKFTYSANDNYIGEINFSYVLCETNNQENKFEAKVKIFANFDNDCDGILDPHDIDNDNDGITDDDEGMGMLDTDGDSIPDNYDIDSDNDGIPDNYEWQMEKEFIPQSELDSNYNGWDDAYDITVGGTYYEPVDTDNNGVPDYLDSDSDNDGILDKIEGFDEDQDGYPEIEALNCDTDKDGLDDAYDVKSCWTLGFNSAGSNCSLPDFNKNGIRDWREKNAEIIEDPFSSLEFNANAFVFPNPSNGVFTVNVPKINEVEEITVSIFSVRGKLIYYQNVQIGPNYFSLHNLESGVYFVKLKSNTFNHSQNILIHK